MGIDKEKMDTYCINNLLREIKKKLCQIRLQGNARAEHCPAERE
jgi:hypothetical protein